MSEGTRRPRLEQVTPGIYAYVQPDGSWFLNNTGFLVGNDGVTVIDMCGTESRSRLFLDALRSTTPRPVRTLVNTHAHQDHTHGNYLLTGAVIVGHARCRDAILAMGVGNPLLDSIFPGVDWGHLEAAPPTLTFTDRLTLFVDDVEVQLIHIGPAHTDHDVVAWIPSRRTLFAGDLCFNGGHPNNVGGSISGTIAAMAALTNLDPEVVVPGHGDVCGPWVFTDMTSYMEKVRSVARDGLAAALTPLDAARQADMSAFSTWLDPERLVGNLHRAYAEITGGTVDLQAAFGDMIAFNGGPLRCLA